MQESDGWKGSGVHQQTVLNFIAMLINTVHASHAHGVPMIVQTPPKVLDSETKTMPAVTVL